MRVLLLLFTLTATAGAQAVGNSTSNSAALPSTGACPPGSLNCVPGTTQQPGTTPLTAPGPTGPTGTTPPELLPGMQLTPPQTTPVR